MPTCRLVTASACWLAHINQSARRASCYLADGNMLFIARLSAGGPSSLRLQQLSGHAPSCGLYDASLAIQPPCSAFGCLQGHETAMGRSKLTKIHGKGCPQVLVHHGLLPGPLAIVHHLRLVLI